MKTTIINITQMLVMGCLLFIGIGCSDFLEETDPSNITADNYFKTAEHAETAIYSIYSNLREVRGGSYGGSPWLMLEFATGLAESDLGQADNSNTVSYTHLRAHETDS